MSEKTGGRRDDLSQKYNYTGGLQKWRRERDSNPRCLSAYTISSRARSTGLCHLSAWLHQPLYGISDVCVKAGYCLNLRFFPQQKQQLTVQNRTVPKAAARPLVAIPFRSRHAGRDPAALLRLRSATLSTNGRPLVLSVRRTTPEVEGLHSIGICPRLRQSAAVRKTRTA